MPKTTNLLISIDPGKASGFAVLDYTDLDDIKITYSGELDQFETCSMVENLLVDSTSFTYEIVMEKFTVTPQTGKNSNEQNWSSEIIGCVRYLAEKHGISFTEQTPARAKTFVPNDRMKAVGIWHTGGEGHAKDALRHAVLYLVEKKGWRPAGLLADDE